MEKERLAYLITAYLDNDIKSAEEQELMHYMGNGDLHDLRDFMDQSWATKENLLILDEHKANEIYASILSSTVTQTPGKNRGIFQLNGWWLSAVAVIAFVAVGVTFFYARYNTRSANDEIAVVVPGKNSAVLTLANGKKIGLTDAKNGRLASLSGITITKSQDGTVEYNISSNNKTEISEGFNTIETPRGGQYTINLPDGSSVTLNAASVLKFSTAFLKGNHRNVYLSGEGYFEVAKDKNKPFRVYSQNQVVEVLGTHFNVNAYMDENSLKTTLLEGSVKVNRTIIKPGQQAVLIAKQVTVLEADVEMETAWKNGKFLFSGQDFKSAMRAIARWYDIEVIYDTEPENFHIGGTLSRSRSLNEVLKVLQATGDVNFKVEGRRIRVVK